jgi:hypothetical protein
LRNVDDPKEVSKAIGLAMNLEIIKEIQGGQ